MTGTFLKWLIPGLVTVVGGTALAVTQEPPQGLVAAEIRPAVTDGSASVDQPEASALLDVGPHTSSVPQANSSSAGLGTANGPGKSDTIEAALRVKTNSGSSQLATEASAVVPYVWSATKSANGTVTITGYVPNDATREAADRAAGDAVNDSTEVASGEPAGFAADLAAGLAALGHLTTGTAAYDGSKWHLSGTIVASVDGDAAVAALTRGSSGGTLWSSSIVGYPPAAASQAAQVSIAPDITSLSPNQSSSSSSEAVASSSTSAEEPMPSASASSSEISSAPVASSSAEVPVAASLESSSASSESSSISFPPSASAASIEPSSVEAVAASSASSSEAAPASASEAPVASSSEETSSAEEPSSSSVEVSASSSTEASGASAEVSASSSEASPALSVSPTSLSTLPSIPDDLVFEADRSADGSIALKGVAPTAADVTTLASAAGLRKATGVAPQDGLPPDFTANGTAGIAALSSLIEGTVGFDGSKWYLRGKADQKSSADDASSRIAALPGASGWSVGIDVLPPLAACQADVDAIAKRNAITFSNGKATLIASSMPVIDELANDLAICPKTDVHVQGHTDADGNTDVNLGLSVARAEAVVDELIKRGIGEERLYAEGFGESDPIAPNDTKDGKAKNRRITFQVTQE